MKVDLFESHDRLLDFKKQKDYITQGCEECIRNRPEEFGNHPFYIFAHCRTHDNGYTKRLIWEPRLTKPTAQTNSMLFKAYPPTDKIKVIWMLPARELFDQYKKGYVTESMIVQESINAFDNDRNKLEMKEEDDLQDYQIDDIYRAISNNLRNRKSMQALSVASLVLEDLMV